MDKIDSFSGAHSFLSNFYNAAGDYPIVYEGVRYPRVENAFQAAKLLPPDQVDSAQRSEIVGQFIALPAGKAKRLGAQLRVGRKLGHLARPDWFTVSLAIMEELVRQKFGTYADLRGLLMDTGDAELIEGNRWNDRFWGVCNGVGENHLGKILMKVRAELRHAR
jgi:ribA/ribD-fused uncharacterized protein